LTLPLLGNISNYYSPHIPDTTKFKTTIIYDNYVIQEGTKSDWGFSCLVEISNMKILFDTGTRSEILIDNMKLLDINPTTVDKIIISHNHFDHTGGLFSVLEKNNDAEVYLTYSTPKNYVERVNNLANKLILEKERFELDKNVYLSGEMGDAIREQCMVIDTPKGLYVITGCSHPGIIDMLRQIKINFGKEIFAVLGGFHLMNKSEKEMDDILKGFQDLKIVRVGATHCTGEKQINIFREAYGENFIELGVGKVLHF